jgi:hypothetical protein
MFFVIPNFFLKKLFTCWFNKNDKIYLPLDSSRAYNLYSRKLVEMDRFEKAIDKWWPWVIALGTFLVSSCIALTTILTSSPLLVQCIYSYCCWAV